MTSVKTYTFIDKYDENIVLDEPDTIKALIKNRVIEMFIFMKKIKVGGKMKTSIIEGNTKREICTQKSK